MYLMSASQAAEKLGTTQQTVSRLAREEKLASETVGGRRVYTSKAIDAYLDTMEAPQAQRVERRIQQYFSATERYPRQLREMDRATYAALKKDVYSQ